MQFSYNFPAHRDTGRVPMLAQVGKVEEEAHELSLAYIDWEGDDRVLEECLDTIHACETLLRRYPVEKVKAARDAVIDKNRERGYYDA